MATSSSKRSDTRRVSSQAHSLKENDSPHRSAMEAPSTTHYQRSPGDPNPLGGGRDAGGGVMEDIADLGGQDVILGDVYQSMAMPDPDPHSPQEQCLVSEGNESPRSHALLLAGERERTGTAGSMMNYGGLGATTAGGNGNGNAGQTINYLREDYEQLQAAMGIISCTGTEQGGGAGSGIGHHGSRSVSPGPGGALTARPGSVSSTTSGRSSQHHHQAPPTVSQAVAKAGRSNFEALSREMLVDYCWEVHQTMLRALYIAGPDGNLIGQDGAILGPRPPSTLYAGMMSRHASMTPSQSTGGGHSTSAPVNVNVLDGMGNHVVSMHNMNAVAGSPSSGSGNQPGASGGALTPQPPNDRSSKSGGVGGSSTIMTMGRGGGSNLSSVYPAPQRMQSSMTASSLAHSIQSIARAPVPTTQNVERAVDQQGRKMINQYCILEEIGKGCFGKVKLAYNTAQGQLVAVKVMKRVDPAKRGASSAQAAINAAHRNRSMQKEIAVMKKLRHKSIVSLFEVIDDPASCSLYLVMQYIDLGALGAVDKHFKCGRVDQKLMANYGRQICAGLQYLHNHNVVHRDIKPDNILKDSNDQMYLADFGVSEMFDVEELVPNESAEPNHVDCNNQSQKGGVDSLVNDAKFGKKVHGRRGTPAFMAPELMTDASAEHDGFAIDVWALGVTFYALLFGIIPFCSKDEIVGKKVQFPKPADYGEGEVPITQDWVKLLTAMLSKKPSDRPEIEEVRKTVRAMHKEQELRDQLQLKKEPSQNSNSTGCSEAEYAAALTPLQTGLSPSMGGGGDRVVASSTLEAISDARRMNVVNPTTSPTTTATVMESPSANLHRHRTASGAAVIASPNQPIQPSSQYDLNLGDLGDTSNYQMADPATPKSPLVQKMPLPGARGGPNPIPGANNSASHSNGLVGGVGHPPSGPVPQHQSPQVAMASHGGTSSRKRMSIDMQLRNEPTQPFHDVSASISNPSVAPLPSKVSDGMKLPELTTPRRANSGLAPRPDATSYPSSGPPSTRTLVETHDPQLIANTARGHGSGPPVITPRSQVVTITNKTAASRARAKLQKLKDEEANSGGDGMLNYSARRVAPLSRR